MKTSRNPRTMLWIGSISLWCLLHSASGTFFEYGSDVHGLKNAKDFKARVSNSSFLVMVAFYREGCGFCVLLEKEWDKAATDLKHMVHFAGVDTERARPLTTKAAQKYDIKIEGVPTIVAFTPKASKPMVYDGERKAGAIKKWAASHMPDFITRLTPATYRKWSEKGDAAGARNVVVLSDKPSPASLLKAVASEYRGRVSFGLAPKSEFRDLCRKFGVETFPALVALRRPADDFEDEAWVAKHFGGAQHSVMQLGGGAAKPTFRSLDFWVMPLARPARPQARPTSKRNAEL